MKNNFSHELKEVIAAARDEALRLHTNFIGPRHLILALAKKQPAVFNALLGNSRSTLPEIVHDAELSIPGEEEATNTGAVVSKFRLFKRPARPAVLYLNRPAEKVIRGSLAVAKKASSTTVEPEHLFQSILENSDAIHPR